MNSKHLSAGARLRAALESEHPLQVVGTINAYSSLMAERVGFRALYVSGAGVANASHGWPDLALTTLNDVIEDARRITSITDLSVLIDIDTGWGNALMVNRAIRELIHAGAAGVHIEDQVQAKRCGHLPGKTQVSAAEMIDRVKAVVDAKTDPDFVVMARTDALAVEGLEPALTRARQYQEAGADMLFPEALTEMVVEEDPRYSRDYLDPEKRAIANGVQVFFRDGTASEKVVVEYPPRSQTATYGRSGRPDREIADEPAYPFS